MEFKSVNNLEFNSAVSGHKQNEEERCWWKNSVAPRQFANKYEGEGGGGGGVGGKVTTYVSILR